MSLLFVVERSYGKTGRANAKPLRLSWTHGAINTRLIQPEGGWQASTKKRGRRGEIFKAWKRARTQDQRGSQPTTTREY